jgi:hypothetical protein
MLLPYAIDVGESDLLNSVLAFVAQRSSFLIEDASTASSSTPATTTTASVKSRAIAVSVARGLDLISEYFGPFNEICPVSPPRNGCSVEG